MGDKKVFAEANLAVKNKLGKLGFEISTSRLEKSEKEKIIQSFRDVSYFTGVAMGTISRHQDIADSLILKLDKTIKILEERLLKTEIENETKAVVETEILVLKNTVKELKKIGFE